jgi:hypothetical protein
MWKVRRTEPCDIKANLPKVSWDHPKKIGLKKKNMTPLFVERKYIKHPKWSQIQSQIQSPQLLSVESP